MTERRQLLALHETLTSADHQTHRRYTFTVPPGCSRLEMHVAYSPKHLGEAESAELAWSALRTQARQFSERVGAQLAEAWSADLTQRAERVRIANLVTLSLDDASGAYRGAGHRQAPDQMVFIESNSASPGLVAGPIGAGEWRLTLSVHTLVTPQCVLDVQIGAEVPTSTP